MPHLDAGFPALEHANRCAQLDFDDQRGLGHLPALPGDAPAPDPEGARAVLDQLAPLLERDDTAAADLFERSRSLLLATYGTAAMQLGRHVAAFDYPAALAAVRDLLMRITENKS